MLNGSEACFTLHNGIGDAILRHRAGRKTTSLMGSMLCVMTMSAAFLASMRPAMLVEAVFDEEGFLGALLTTIMSEVE